MISEGNNGHREVTLSSYAVDAAREFHSNPEEQTLTERKAEENDGTMVTVVCITYKHEEFIAQALDSFLMQKTNFKFKVFVGEDCGPDGTADIVREYAARYPDIIVPFIREKNMGAQRNLIDLCQRATSPYIAFCEGDDYWIDEYKLQKQVDYMESHPECRASFTKTRIDAPEDWHLRSWYKPTKDGELIIPDSLPGYKEQPAFPLPYVVNYGVAHTSTHFYRWIYDLDIPDWYYDGIIGDISLQLLQLGMSDLGFIPDITSVYRINEGSVWFASDRESHFLRTRLDYIRFLSGLIDFGQTHYENYPVVVFEDRIKREISNYLRICVQNNDIDAIAAFFADYPEGGRLALIAYLSFYRDSQLLTNCYGWRNYQIAVRNKYCRNMLKPFVRIASALIRFKGWLRGKVKNLAAFFFYWKNTFVKKDPNLWVFSAFNKKGYLDNAKYFYEYVAEHHPEINAVWLTLDREVYDQLSKEGKPVMMMRTHACRKLVSHASVAVMDHYRMSDYDAFSGLNDRLKIIQLWHGVGLKSTKNLIKSTTVPGTVYSDDILPQEGDGIWTRVVKKLKYFRHAYYRELFEKWIVVCPGQLQVTQFAQPLNIPLDQCIICGFPRNLPLYQTPRDTETVKILYAPTYRWNAQKERKLVEMIVSAAPDIQARMETLNARIVIRLHPHTWRSYTKKLNQLSAEYNHIEIDSSKDIYETLGSYSIIISDYSSIVNDFVLLDRPIIYFNYDFEEYTRRDTEMDFEYDDVTPGPKVKDWAQVLDAISEYVKDPEKDGDKRREIRNFFYDMSVNDANNSERIVCELKRRLSQPG